ncbi:hypothetical protein [Sinomonas sp. G460-2]|uniref:hypothetical protein n=1 Tax=Sinomonas sp. G460-2 TaxID=3393464 RepID=UPI0039F06EB7
MSSRNVIARHRAAPVRSIPVRDAVQAASGNADSASRQAGVFVAGMHLTVMSGSPAVIEDAQRKAAILSDAFRAPCAVASKKANSPHLASSAFYTLR